VGKIVDESSKKPMSYANVSAFRLKDSTLVGGSITDEKGFFKIEKLHPGMYKIKVDFIGYNRYNTTTKVTPQTPSVNLGVISLKPSVTQLSEVDVQGEKSLVSFKLDKKVINVDKNIVTSGGNATDILRNTPSVSVDMDGNVSLRGSTNVNILVDGKPSTLSANDKAAILEQIPASTIERIEIITNPSAKYDPEGMAGILNIITKKEKRQGINGLVTLNYGTMKKFGGSLSVNRRLSNTNLFLSYDYRNDDRNGSRNQDRLIYYNDTLLSHTVISSTQTNNNYSHNIKGGFDYNFNPLNSINFTTTYRIGQRNGDDLSKNMIYNNDNLLITDYERDDASKRPNQNIDLSLGYKKKFDEPDRELTADMYYSLGLFNEDENYTQNNVIPHYFQKTSSDDKYSNITFQSDYTHPINEKNRLDAGIKAMVRTTDNNYFFYNFDTLASDFKNDTNLSNHFVYSDFVYAGYATFSHEWKKISFQAGLRAEETVQQGDQKTSNYTFYRDYFNFFPSIHLSYNMPKDNKLQLSYSRRINRPDPHSINPFIDKSDPLTWHMGNPNLKPEYIDSYEFGYIKNWKKISLTSDIFYKATANVVSRYRSVDTTGIITVFPINMNKAESYGFEFIANSQPVPFMRLMADFSWYKTVVIGSDNSSNDLTNSIYSYDAKFNASFYLPKNFSFQLNGMFMGPSIMAQATRKQFFTVDAGLRKDLWNKKASLSLRLSDIFNTMKFQVETNDPSLKALMQFKRETRILYVTFTYNINGGVKQKDRQRQQQDMNNDNNLDMGE
jgi:outer membrane receptor protein involved in Fe transport